MRIFRQVCFEWMGGIEILRLVRDRVCVYGEECESCYVPKSSVGPKIKLYSIAHLIDNLRIIHAVFSCLW